MDQVTRTLGYQVVPERGPLPVLTDATRYLWDWFLMLIEDPKERNSAYWGSPDDCRKTLVCLTGIHPHPWEMSILYRLFRRWQRLVGEQN